MPQFNKSGQITPRIGVYWFDQTEFFTQDCASPCPGDVSPCPSHNGCHMVVGNKVAAHVGANSYRAGGSGVWAVVDARPTGDPTTAIYMDSFGRTRTNSFPVAVGPDGVIAIKPHSNAYVILLHPNGAEPVIHADAGGLKLLGDDKRIYAVGGAIHANFPLKHKPAGLVWGFSATAEGDIVYQNQPRGELVLNGKVIGPPSPNYFHLDILRLGDRVLVTWAPTEADMDGIVKSYTDAELATYPDVGVPDKPEEPKKEEPPKKELPNMKHIIEEVRKLFDTPLGADHWKFMVLAAQRTGSKVFRKDGGSNVFVPALGFSISMDILIKDGYWIDILGDAEGEAKPDWTAHPNAGEPEKWIDVSHIKVELDKPEEPKEEEPKEEEPKEDVELQKRVSELEAAVKGLEKTLGLFIAQTGQAVLQVNQLAGELAEAVQELQNKPQPRFRAKGSTKTRWGHIHDVDVEVVEVK